MPSKAFFLGVFTYLATFLFGAVLGEPIGYLTLRSLPHEDPTISIVENHYPADGPHRECGIYVVAINSEHKIDDLGMYIVTTVPVQAVTVTVPYRIMIGNELTANASTPLIHYNASGFCDFVMSNSSDNSAVKLSRVGPQFLDVQLDHQTNPTILWIALANPVLPDASKGITAYVDYKYDLFGITITRSPQVLTAPKPCEPGDASCRGPYYPFGEPNPTP